MITNISGIIVNSLILKFFVNNCLKLIYKIRYAFSSFLIINFVFSANQTKAVFYILKIGAVHSVLRWERKCLVLGFYKINQILQLITTIFIRLIFFQLCEKCCFKTSTIFNISGLKDRNKEKKFELQWWCNSHNRTTGYKGSIR